MLLQPLARLGAEVLGLDASAENVAVAETHARQDAELAGRLSYRACLVEHLAAEQGPAFHAVVASEVIEHVADAAVFVQACCDLLKVDFRELNPQKRVYVEYKYYRPLSYDVCIDNEICACATWLQITTD